MSKAPLLGPFRILAQDACKLVAAATHKSFASVWAKALKGSLYDNTRLALDDNDLHTLQQEAQEAVNSLCSEERRQLKLTKDATV